jgi:hypothetical protein
MSASAVDDRPTEAVASMRQWELNPGVLADTRPQRNGFTLWLPGGQEGRYRHWERVTNPAPTLIELEPGILATAATVAWARERMAGVFGRLLGTGAGSALADWAVPGGAVAARCGQHARPRTSPHGAQGTPRPRGVPHRPVVGKLIRGSVP